MGYNYFLTMKKINNSILLCFILLALTYLPLVFVEWSFNPKEWHVLTRLLWAFVAVLPIIPKENFVKP